MAHGWADTEGCYRLTGEPMTGAYNRTRIMDLLPEEADGKDDRRRERHRPLDQRSMPQLDTERPGQITQEALLRNAQTSKTAKLRVRVGMATFHRRLVMTDTGYMGLAHERVAVGDQIWLLLGGEMPVALRPVRK